MMGFNCFQRPLKKLVDFKQFHNSIREHLAGFIVLQIFPPNDFYCSINGSDRVFLELSAPLCIAELIIFVRWAMWTTAPEVF